MKFGPDITARCPSDHVIHADQSVGFGIRQRLQQHAVDDAEDGAVGADAERQREHGDEREARRLDEAADRVVKSWRR